MFVELPRPSSHLRFAPPHAHPGFSIKRSKPSDVNKKCFSQSLGTTHVHSSIIWIVIVRFHRYGASASYRSNSISTKPNLNIHIESPSNICVTQFFMFQEVGRSQRQSPWARAQRPNCPWDLGLYWGPGAMELGIMGPGAHGPHGPHWPKNWPHDISIIFLTLNTCGHQALAAQNSKRDGRS
jgi:hypothetical protein